MYFEIICELSAVETIAIGSGIREIARSRQFYERGRWRNRKGIAHVRLSHGEIAIAELLWYEATGIGRGEFKIKRYIENCNYGCEIERARHLREE